jgi:hypothetical protein
MKFRFTFSILLVMAALPSLALAQPDPSNFPLTPVCDTQVDDDGDCVTDALGDTVCVRGLVLAWKHYGSRGPGAIYDPVSGCCISIFDLNRRPDLPIGTLVEVCGWVGRFAGLTEITDEPGRGSNDPVVTVLDSVPSPVPCTPISAADIADFSPLGEELESCLVSVCGRFVDSGVFPPASSGRNYDFVDINGDTCEIRIDRDTGIEGTPIPSGNVSVKGVLGQFNIFLDICIGYQVLPRSLADFSPPTCEVDVDVKPQSCENPFNTGSQGVLPVAILGSDVLDVNDIDVSSLTLNGVSPVHSAIEDVSTPAVGGGDCPCTEAGADGFDDLTLKFRRQDIAATLPTLGPGDVTTLSMVGSLLDGTDFEGSDCITIRVGGGPPLHGGGAQLSISRDWQTSLNRISYVLGQEDDIKLGVYDVAGRLVTQLYAGHQAQGRHDIDWNTRSHANGIYFVRLEGRHIFATKKVAVLE